MYLSYIYINKYMFHGSAMTDLMLLYFHTSVTFKYCFLCSKTSIFMTNNVPPCHDRSYVTFHFSVTSNIRSVPIFLQLPYSWQNAVHAAMTGLMLYFHSSVTFKCPFYCSKTSLFLTNSIQCCHDRNLSGTKTKMVIFSRICIQCIVTDLLTHSRCIFVYLKGL